MDDERMLSDLFTHDPDWMCPRTKRLMDFVVKTLSEDERGFLSAHISSCDSCRSRLAVLREAAEAEVDMPPESRWAQLPRGVLPEVPSIENRLRRALRALKSVGGEDARELIDRVNDLAGQLLAPPEQIQPSYALSRDATMPSRTDLQLRMPRPPEKIRIEMDDISVQLDSNSLETRIRLARGRRPLKGARVTVVFEGREPATVTTNAAGEAILVHDVPPQE
jgi:hypothetical protein